MHAARVWVDVVLQSIRVGRFQLLQLAVVQNPRGEVMGCGEVLKHIGRGGPLAGLGFLTTLKRHVFKEDLADLCRALHVERLACHFMQFGLKTRHLLGEGIGHTAKRVAVDENAMHLHFREHRHQRAFEGFVNRGDLLLVQLRLEILPKAERDICIFGGIFHGVLKRHLVKGDRGFPRAQQRFDRDRVVAEVALTQHVHPVIMFACVHRVRHQHRVIDR